MKAPNALSPRCQYVTMTVTRKQSKTFDQYAYLLYDSKALMSFFIAQRVPGLDGARAEIWIQNPNWPTNLFSGTQPSTTTTHWLLLGCYLLPSSSSTTTKSTPSPLLSFPLRVLFPHSIVGLLLFILHWRLVAWFAQCTIAKTNFKRFQPQNSQSRRSRSNEREKKHNHATTVLLFLLFLEKKMECHDFLQSVVVPWGLPCTGG